jgi:hypothetical protein
VTGAEPVAGIPVLVPGFVTEAGILMVRPGSVWPGLGRWPGLLALAGRVVAAPCAVGL